MSYITGNSKKLYCKKRKGMGMVECLILIIVVAFTVGAMLQTSYITSQMQVAGRRYVSSHKSMVTFFNALESVVPTDIHGNDILDTVQKIIETENYVNISNVSAVTNDKVVTVSITLTDSDRKTKVITSNYNVFSNKTVSDDRDKNRV